ncbi:MAG TPA: hypothetical protein PLG06_07890 [Anaerolineae bacterium]|nr:hypothetical protein [Anaerolineae bacterium]
MINYRRRFMGGVALLLAGIALVLLGSFFEAHSETASFPMFTPSPLAVETDDGVGAGSVLAAELGSALPDTSTPLVTPTVRPPAPTPAPLDDFSCDPANGLARPRCAGGWPAERLSPLTKRMLVGLYGTPLGRGLGILGTVSPTETVTLAREQAAAYQTLLTNTTVVPFFHMVVTIADAYPGEDGDYNHRVPTATIQLWIDVARANGLLAVLDIQPAHSPLLMELDYIAPFVRQRGVHLALDPEFTMPAGTVPGERLGRMDGDSVNLAQAWLTERAWEAGERKLLIIHQFDDCMFVDKDRIQPYAPVELIWDADGFGGPPAKIADHLQYAAEPGFEYSGFKLFYGYDVPLMTPADVLRLQPRPVFVVYQ